MSLNFRGHPLVGIWSGVYGEHGSELVFVHEVAGKEGYIFATKLTGDVNVPAGLVSFWLHVGYGSEVITGKGQIAGKGHVDVSWVETRLNCISNDEFEVTWVPIEWTTTFKRVDFPAPDTF